MHQQMNLLIDRYSHFRGHNVIFRIWIVVDIETKNILISLVNFVRMKRPKLPVRPWISKIKRKLSGLYLNRERVRAGWCEVDCRPRLLAEGAEDDDFEADQNECGAYQTFCSTGECP